MVRRKITKKVMSVGWLQFLQASHKVLKKLLNAPSIQCCCSFCTTYYFFLILLAKSQHWCPPNHCSKNSVLFNRTRIKSTPSKMGSTKPEYFQTEVATKWCLVSSPGWKRIEVTEKHKSECLLATSHIWW